MITIATCNHPLQFPETLHEIPLGEFLAWYTKHPIPDADEDTLIFLQHVQATIAHFADCSLATAAGIDADRALAAYNVLMQNIQEYEPSSSDTFEIQGETYYLPDPKMRGSKLIDFIEAAQFEHLAKQTNPAALSHLPDLMCLLLRTSKDEPYSPDLLNRRDVFNAAPTSIAFDVAFFLLRRNEQFWTLFQLCKVEEQLIHASQGQALTKSKPPTDSTQPS